MKPRSRDNSDQAAIQLLSTRTVCPSNDDIAAAIGARGAGGGAACLKRLEASGQIIIERPVPGWRKITFTDVPVSREGEDA